MVFRMSKNQSEDETILKLMKLIDNGKSILFKRFDSIKGWFSFSLGCLICLLILNDIILIHDVLTSGNIPFISTMTISLSILAVFTAFISLLVRFKEENIVRVNYNRMKRCVEENERPLLKALIKMKTVNIEFSLKQIYDMHPSMFKKEKLLERLYEQK